MKLQQGLKKRIWSRDVRIAVIGLGYVGLPLAVNFAEERFSVIGVDKSRAKIDPLLAGRTTVEGLAGNRIAKQIRNNRLKPVHVTYLDRNQPSLETISELLGVDIFVICVQTPLRSARGWEPDITWINSARQLIDSVCEMEIKAGRLPAERLIILESTTYPGTTRNTFEELVRGISEKHQVSWYLAYSPERTDPGPKAHLLGRGKHRRKSKIPRIVAGLDENSKELAFELYQTVFDKVEPVASLETAEMIKLVENTFRFVSIGFANEMGTIARAFDLNIWEVIHGVKTKGFGLDICYPGLIGGHCIPIDPHYLGSAARKKGRVSTFIDTAETVHQQTKREARDLIHRLLGQQNKGIRNSRILFFGVAYKRNVSDVRESPSLDVMKDLFVCGAKLSYWDPLLDLEAENNPLHLAFNKQEKMGLPKRLTRRFTHLQGYPSESSYLLIDALRGSWEDLRNKILHGSFDCVVLATNHDCFLATYEELMLSEPAPAVADLRNSIGTWLTEDKKPSEGKIALVRKRAESRKKYMLLGVH